MPKASDNPAEDPRRTLRFMGMPSLLRAPHRPDPSGLDVALLGVPYDGGVTNRPGARHGPREIRNASGMVRQIHPTSRLDPYAMVEIGDLGDVPFAAIFDETAVTDDITTAIAGILAAGAMPLVIGGDHSISFPVLRAIGAEQPVGLIHIDAHTDTWDAFHGSKFHHGAPFRLAVEAGLIDPTRTVQIGIRGAQNFPDGWDYSREAGMRVIFMHEVDGLGIAGVIEEARRVVGDDPVYLTFDIDALDPVHAPGTGTPEIGGFTTREALALLRGLRGLNFVGADLVEVSPPFDLSGLTALAGASLAYEILCLLAGRIAGAPD